MHGKSAALAGAVLIFATAATASAALAATPAPSGEEFTPDPGAAPGSFAFDKRDGKFAHLDVDVSCAVNAVRANVRFSRYGTRSTPWVPGVGVLLRHGKEILGLFVAAAEYRAPFTAELRRFDSDGKLIEARRFSATVGADGSFSFFARWTGDGELIASVGGETQSLSLGAPVEKLILSGYSGAGEFDPLEIGRYRDNSNADDTCKPIARLSGVGFG